MQINPIIIEATKVESGFTQWRKLWVFSDPRSGHLLSASV